MDIQSIKDKLQSSEYEFLRTDSHLRSNILILTTAGSIAYGTNVDTSDIDVRGVTIETKQDLVGLSSYIHLLYSTVKLAKNAMIRLITKGFSLYLTFLTSGLFCIYIYIYIIKEGSYFAISIQIM